MSVIISSSASPSVSRDSVPVNMSPESSRNDGLRARALLLDERGEVRRAAEPRRPAQPVGGNRLERAVEVVRVEHRDVVRAATQATDVAGRERTCRGQRRRRHGGAELPPGHR